MTDNSKPNLQENDFQLIDSLLEMFIDIEPSEDEIIDYLEGRCDSATLLRLERHFERNSSSRRQMGILKQVRYAPILENMKTPEAIPDLLNILNDETVDPWVKGSVIAVLNEINAQESSDIILSILNNEISTIWLKEKSALALANMQNKESLPALKDFLKTENIDDQVRNVIAENIIEMEKETSTLLEIAKGVVSQVSERISETTQNIIELRAELKNWSFNNLFSLSLARGGASGESSSHNKIETIFSNDHLRVIEKKNKTNDLEINVFTPILELEGGIMTITAGDIFQAKQFLFRRGDEVGATFLILLRERKSALEKTELIISEIKTLGEITLEDMTPDLENRLTAMANSKSLRENEAAKKIKEHLSKLSD